MSGRTSNRKIDYGIWRCNSANVLSLFERLSFSGGRSTETFIKAMKHYESFHQKSSEKTYYKDCN